MSDYCSCCGEVKSTPICADCLNETIDLMTAKGDKLTAARERIRTLETELKWAWERLPDYTTSTMDELTYCIGCDACLDTGDEHKPDCEVIKHQEQARAVLSESERG